VSRNIDIIFIAIVLFIYAIKTLVTYQLTNDNSLCCLRKLNTSIVKTRLVNVRTTQKWLRNSTCTTVAQRLQPHPFGWTKTWLTTSCWTNRNTITLRVVLRWIQFPPLSYRWTCSIQRHHTRSYLVYYITRKH
jgi:hypothetical protein